MHWTDRLAIAASVASAGRYKLAKKKDNDRIEGKFLLHKDKEGNNENASRTKATVQLPFPATVSS